MISQREDFLIDLRGNYQKLSLDPSEPQLSDSTKTELQSNVSLFRDTIVYFTASASARGLNGHTGGAYDTVPEVCMMLALMEQSPDRFHPVIFDEAGHRVATQYLLSALNGQIPLEQLLHYREAHSQLPGHPELGLTPGVTFSSGRLGHLWALVNGVCLANPEKVVFCLGSDGSQQEGHDAEAARFAVAQNLNIKLIVDDNDTTISGHPSEYLKGFSIASTLKGHGMKVLETNGEDLFQLYGALREAVTHDAPVAVVCKRPMCPGIDGLEGKPAGHESIPVKLAVQYLEDRSYHLCAEQLKSIIPHSCPYPCIGSTKEKYANRVVFGEAVSSNLSLIPPSEAQRRFLVIDSDLESSTVLSVIRKQHPSLFLSSGIMERANFSAAAGFGMSEDKCGIFATFSAFSEMVISEVTMARLNQCNVLCHFSHAGVDEIVDNTCHFGINMFFLDNGLEVMEKEAEAKQKGMTRLYFPGDAEQMRMCVSKVMFEKGLRFVFSARAKTPLILKEGSEDLFYGDRYGFEDGKDDLIRRGTRGYVVSYGDMLHRAVDAVDRLRADGIDVGLVAKSTLNVVDEKSLKEYGSAPFVLVVESLNQKMGLGSRMGTWLLQRSLTPKYGCMGATNEGCGGLEEQIWYQGLDPDSIMRKVRSLV